MRTACRATVALLLAFVVAAPLAAAEGKKGKKGTKGAKRPDPTASAFALPKTITLTEEQQDKIKELRAQYRPKLVEVMKKQGAVLTDEQKTARKEFFKEAKAAGKKPGKALQEELEKALNLTDEQKADLAKVRQEMNDLRKEIRECLMDVLTDEQKAEIKKSRGAGKKRTKKSEQ